MNKLIQPTVGRVVWYRGNDNVVRAAIVAAVNGVFNLNLHVFGKDQDDAEHGLKMSVTHADAAIETACFPSWDWMPYQKQAAKNEPNNKLCSGSVGCDPQVVISDASFAVPVPSKSNAQIKMDFGDAIEALKQGHAVARQLWNGMWIALGEGNPILEADKFWNPHSKQHALNQGGTAAVAPYIIFKNYQDEIQMGWQPSQADVLSVDWIIVD